MREIEVFIESWSKDEGGMSVTSMQIYNYMLTAQTLNLISTPLLLLNDCSFHFLPYSAFTHTHILFFDCILFM